MNIAFISTGTELLKGSAVNTNLSFFGTKLAENGIPLHQEIACGDAPDEIAEAISDAVRTSQILLISGGLGPTSDDRTLETTARFFGRELHQDPVLTQKVENFWNNLKRGFACPKMQYKQAMLPEDGTAIDNPVGSASGIFFKCSYAGTERMVFLVPGPPSEFEPMIANEIIPRLLKLIPERKNTCGFLCAGVGESLVAKALEKPVTALGAEIAYCANPCGTRVFITSGDPAVLEQGVTLARKLIGDAAFPAGVLDPVVYLAQLLREKKWHFGTAESCTGGMIAEKCVDLPGISDIYYGSVVSYANSVKNHLLGIPQELLDTKGAVSPEVAEAMAKGAAAALGTECAMATTGIAGPGGGTPEKPVGLVYVSAVTPERCEVREFRFRGSRTIIRARAAAKAVLLLIELLRGNAE